MFAGYTSMEYNNSSNNEEELQFPDEYLPPQKSHLNIFSRPQASQVTPRRVTATSTTKSTNNYNYCSSGLSTHHQKDNQGFTDDFVLLAEGCELEGPIPRVSSHLLLFSPINQPITHPFIHSLTHSFTHSPVHSLTHPFILPIHSLAHDPTTHPLIHPPATTTQITILPPPPHRSPFYHHHHHTDHHPTTTTVQITIHHHHTDHHPPQHQHPFQPRPLRHLPPLCGLSNHV